MPRTLHPVSLGECREFGVGWVGFGVELKESHNDRHDHFRGAGFVYMSPSYGSPKYG